MMMANIGIPVLQIPAFPAWPEHLTFGHFILLLIVALGLGGILKSAAALRNWLGMAKVNELSEVRKDLMAREKALEDKIDAKELAWQTKFDAQNTKWDLALKENNERWQRKFDAQAKENKIAREALEQLDRAFYEDRVERECFEDKVLTVIEYKWSDKTAVDGLAQEIKDSRKTRKSRRTKSSIPLASAHILLVDDERDTANVLEKMLRLDGHEVAVAHSGLEALQQIAAARTLGTGFDLFLLDFSMPGMDGGVLAQRIRAGECEEGERPAPIAFLTCNKELISSELEAETRAVVWGKPLGSKELFAKVRGLLDGAR